MAPSYLPGGHSSSGGFLVTRFFHDLYARGRVLGACQGDTRGQGCSMAQLHRAMACTPGERRIPVGVRQQELRVWPGAFSYATPFLHCSLPRQGPDREGGFGLASRPEAGTSEEANTKLRVAEEQKGAGESGPKEDLVGPQGTASLEALRAVRLLKAPAARANCVELLPRGGFGAGGASGGAPFPSSLPLPVPGKGGPKRQAKPAADEGFWDCSVCTFRNSAEAFKCSICDVRKGTSTRKPRINSQLVAQQVAQQYATPPPPKKEKKEKVEKQDKEKPEKDKEISPSVTKKNANKKTKPKSDILKDPPSEANSIQSANATTKTSETNHTSRPRLKNVDRSTAQQLAVTVGNVTVIITDFKEKTRSSSTSSSTVTSSAGSEQQNQSSSGSESTDKGSSRSSTPKGDMSAVNDESF
ncbi:PREDICTED: RING1 and YY1-binding protein [Colobus angolensis palliatus]|uniref:RING1 and YY1-binding protein n=1 Tax=Colobus angolensis palliatus TaxID=336983 RepID=UPI0005F455DB|nr:PREDICTED: RING1 and YY1-binding protein [Colobus angolensis palliatus]